MKLSDVPAHIKGIARVEYAAKTGNVEIDERIYFDKPVNLHIPGYTKTEADLLSSGNTSPPGLYFTGNLGRDEAAIKFKSACRIDGLFVQVNGEAGIGVLFEDAHGCSVKDVTVRGNTTFASIALSNTMNALFTGCKSQHSPGRGFFLHRVNGTTLVGCISSGSLLSPLVVWGFGWPAAKYKGNPSSGLTLVGFSGDCSPTLQVHGTKSMSPAAIFAGVEMVTMYGCRFEGNKGGIVLHSSRDCLIDVSRGPERLFDILLQGKACWGHTVIRYCSATPGNEALIETASEELAEPPNLWGKEKVRGSSRKQRPKSARVEVVPTRSINLYSTDI